MKLMMNTWSKKQFLSKHDETYMRAGDELLKTPALGLQGVPPWNVYKTPLERSDPDLKRRLMEREKTNYFIHKKGEVLL